MKTIMGVAGTCLLAVCLAVSAHAEGKCQRYRLSSLPLSYDRAGRPLIQAKVNGNDIPFLVDTGGLDSVLAYETVETLKLPKSALPMEARAFNVYGQAIGFKTTVETFAIGALAGTNWPFLVSPEHDPAIGNNSGNGGFLGPDIMTKYDIEFDFAANKFNIFTHDDCSGRVVYWSMLPYAALPFRMDGYHIYAKATLDGKTVDVMIDSGASTTFMSSNSASEYGIDRTQLKRRDNPSEIDPYYSYPFKVLDLDGLTISNPDIIIYPEKLGALHNTQEPRPVVVLGTSVLRQLHIYIAYREKVLYLTPADAH